MDKYKIATGIDANKTYLFKNANAIDSHNEVIMAVFLGKDHKTDATKVVDLLNKFDKQSYDNSVIQSRYE